MEVADVGANLGQDFLGLLVVLRVVGVGIQPQVVEGGGQHLVTAVHEGHAALGELLHVLRLEEDGPGVDRLVTEDFLDLGHVVTDAVGAPQVGNRVLVARVADLQLLEQRRIEVLPVRQLALVQLLEGTGLDLLAEEVVRRHHDVIAGVAGDQLALEGLVGVEDVVADVDPALLGEVLEGGGSNVIGPVIDVQALLLRLHGARDRRSQSGYQQCLANGMLHVRLLFRAFSRQHPACSTRVLQVPM